MLTTAFAAFWLTKVDAASQLADTQNVETVRRDVGAQRTELFQSLVQLRRTQVTEQFEMFT
ncbi:hypothetical protein D3C76_938170 [compost metagenome]